MPGTPRLGCRPLDHLRPGATQSLTFAMSLTPPEQPLPGSLTLSTAKPAASKRPASDPALEAPLSAPAL
jgi:hypothetical protein